MPLVGISLLGLSTAAWTAIGAIAAIVAVVVAVLIALQSGMAGSGRERRKRAAQIREQLRHYTAAADRVLDLLESGEAIIGGAAETVKALRAQAGTQVTADSLLQLVGNSAAATSAAVQGSSVSPATEKLNVALGELVAAGNVLSGRLCLFSPITELLRRIAADGASNVQFIRLLTDEPAEQFRGSHRGEDLETLTRSLDAHLHGNAAMYFVARYGEALTSIRSFLDTATSAFAGASLADLVKAADAGEPDRTDGQLTDQLRAGIDAAGSLLTPAVAERLRADADAIAVAISKQAATERLRSS